MPYLKTMGFNCPNKKCNWYSKDEENCSRDHVELNIAGECIDRESK